MPAVALRILRPAGFPRSELALALPAVSPNEIKELRKTLGCTARELAAVLKVDPKLVVSWEAGDLFPTKRHVLALRSLRDRGPAEFPRPTRGKGAGLTRLADPKFWEVVRKLAQHSALFEQVTTLAAEYPDPSDD